MNAGLRVTVRPQRLVVAVLTAALGAVVAVQFVVAVHHGHLFGIAVNAVALFGEGAFFGWAASGAVRRT